MDVAILANLFLFLGTLGVNLGLAGSSNDSATDEDPLYDRANYADRHNGTAGDDTVSADADNQAWFLAGGDDDLTGSSAHDYANLGAGNDNAKMGAGSDIALGSGGNDSIDGGVGADSLFGGADNDQLYGNIGDDSLAGGDGNDELWGGSGADILEGGVGDDTLSGFLHGTAGAGGMVGTEGIDQLIGGDGNDVLTLGHGDLAQGGAGNDSFDLDLRWADGTTVAHITDFNRAEDALQIHYTPQSAIDSSDPVQPTMTLTHTPDGSTQVRMNGTVMLVLDGVTDVTLDDLHLVPDTTTDVSYVAGNYSHEVTGTDGDDSYSGDSDPTAWMTGGGADSLSGSTGADYADLGDGNDHADLGDGADSVLGHAGDDQIDGGLGADTLRGGEGDDSLHGDDGADRMAGDHGNDLMAGGAGADSLLGGGGDDTLSGYSETHAGEASLTANDGADTLLGGDGNDTLIIGHGDFASGGSGADRFVLDAQWADGSTVATINDYVFQTDQIELHYLPRYDAGGTEIPPVVRVIAAADGSHTAILLNGETVANITGTHPVGLGEIVLVRAS